MGFSVPHDLLLFFLNPIRNFWFISHNDNLGRQVSNKAVKKFPGNHQVAVSDWADRQSYLSVVFYPE
jgi:hypothetical protein